MLLVLVDDKNRGKLEVEIAATYKPLKFGDVMTDPVM